MYKWKIENPRRKDLILLNPEGVDINRLDQLFKDIKTHWEYNKEEISKEMISDLFAFHEAIENKNENVLLDYKSICRMYRWIKTEGNFKYDASRFYAWRDALKAFWEFLFGPNYQEFHKYIGNNRYVPDPNEWEAWYKAIGGI